VYPASISELVGLFLLNVLQGLCYWRASQTPKYKNNVANTRTFQVDTSTPSKEKCEGQFLVFGFTAITNEARHVKFGMEIDHTHTYKLCMKYCLQINNYKRGNGAKL